jgi:hypothetical protein
VVEIGAVNAVGHDPYVSQAAERTGGDGGLEWRPPALSTGAAKTSQCSRRILLKYRT